MLNLIIISATVLILVAMFLYVSVKRVVRTENGNVLVTKSIFSNKYKIKPEGGVVIPGLMSGLVIDASPKMDRFTVSSNCMNGTGIISVGVSYTYGIDLSNEINKITLTSLSSVSLIISDMIKSEINSVISCIEFSDVASRYGELSKNISDKIYSKMNEFKCGVVIKSINIDFSSNYSSFNTLFRKVDPVVTLDAISNARKEADEEIEIGKINLDKTKKLNNIEIETYKENNEKEIKLKELEIQKYSRIAEKKKDSDLKDEKSKLDFQTEKLEMEEKNKSKLAELSTESKLKSIKDNKKIELEKLNSDLEVESKKMEIEISRINNELEVSKHKYDVEKQLHDEEVDRKNRELELTIDLPAKAEAKRLKMMAENKAEIRRIDTNSSIESSRLKTEYKKEESDIIADIKDKKDSADLSLYKRMIEIAASNPELAIQWKKIESDVEAIRIKSESLSKLPLESIVINGAGSDISDMLSLTSNSNKDESKSTKDSKKK